MKTNRRGFLAGAGAVGAGLVGGEAASAPLVATTLTGFSEDAGSVPFLTERFLDQHLLEVTPGVSRRLHPPRKHPLNPVVRPERWCEGNIIQPYTTMYDPEDRLFKMWARSGSDGDLAHLGGNAAYMLYFTSRDGVHWDRPELGLVPIAGRRDHNVVFTSDLVSKNVAPVAGGGRKFVVPTRAMEPQGKKAFFWSVARHPQPRDPREKFVALAIVQDHRRGAHLVTSPDGLHWSCADAPFWQTPHDVASTGDDCLMHLVYDELGRKWILYRRIVPEFSERMIANEQDCTRAPVDRYYRSYAYAESADLRQWTGHRFILAMDADDAADTELYQFSCHKLGPTFIGFLSVFYLRDPQPIDIQLATSRDGIHYTRVRRGEAFIPHGGLGYYDYMAMCCSQPEPVIVDDTVYLYYAACNFPHNADTTHADPATVSCGAALATFKRDRYASLETSAWDDGPCRVITKPLTVTHPKLFLNAATWQQGSIRVEVLTRDWQPIPGFTAAEANGVQGDALDHPVQWKDNADLGRLTGQEVRLKFHMTRARLYAMTLSHVDRTLAPVEGEHRWDRQGDTAPTRN